jgi:LEA14-like dessication related protein
MKKILLIGGLGLAGFGVYRYFKYQINQAMSYDYKIKSFRIVDVKDKNVTISVTVEIVNNSSFEVKVQGYDIQLFFKGIPFAKATSDKPFVISPTSGFVFTGQGTVNTDDAKLAVLPFLADIAAQKPIDVEVSGFIKVIFLAVPYTISFDKKKVNYSMDLLKDYGLSKSWNDFKAKHPQLTNIFSFLK